MYNIQKKRISYLKEMARKHKVSEDVCIGIYIIETSYRKFWFRTCEDICVIIGLILNLLFKIPIKNYTIGCCQIGVASILNYSGIYTYEHLSQIDAISVKGMLKVLQGMQDKHNIEILCKKIASYYKKEHIRTASDEAKAFYIGQLYNGRFVYGLKLQDYVIEHNKQKQYNMCLNNEK